MARIAHISDIHFGPTFNVGLWQRVRAQIEEFNPDVVVISGDLVDDPYAFELLAVKCELEELSQQCESRPELFVVPGNHDVLELGNLYHPIRAKWFKRILFSDTRKAREKVEKALGIKLGLNDESKDLSLWKKLRMLNPLGSIWLNTCTYACDRRVQSCDYRKFGRRWPIESVHKQIALACFDSNPQSLRAFAFATGKIDPSQLTRLGGTPNSRTIHCKFCGRQTPADSELKFPNPILLRFAVLHHHPLPIALPDDSFTGQDQESKLEPFLVLRNSGDLLHKLQEQKFDVILHGHKHRAQRARVELQAYDLEEYPLLVLASGSTAKKDEASSSNTLRLIETEPSGRLHIHTVENARRKEAKFYREPIASLTFRAYHRALERVKRAAQELSYQVEIDGVGHVKITDCTYGLRSLSRGHTIRWLPAKVVVPPHADSYAPIQPERFCEGRIRLRWQDQIVDPERGGLVEAIPEGRSEGRWLVELVKPLKPGSNTSLDYGLKSCIINSIAMTQWELQERKRVDERRPGYLSRDDWDYETVWRFVSYPVNRLVLQVHMPKELDEIRPEVRCLRHAKYPDFPLTFRVDEEITYENSFEVDEDIQNEAASKLSHHAGTRTWTLDVDHPLPGYKYEVRWRVPSEVADMSTRLLTEDLQAMLLRLRDDASTPTATVCRDLFRKLANALMRQFKAKNPKERLFTFLMVYNREDVHLHTAMTCPPMQPIKLPLGEGVAGAAFLARRVLAWHDDPWSDTLIRPKALPGWPAARHVLALPIYYQDELTKKLERRAGGVIGVVTLASDAAGSKIFELQADEDPAAKEKAAQAQLLAQEVVSEMLMVLSKEGDEKLDEVAGPV